MESSSSGFIIEMSLTGKLIKRWAKSRTSLKVNVLRVTTETSSSINPISAGGFCPYMFFFHHLETPQAIKLKLSDFKDTFQNTF